MSNFKDWSEVTFVNGSAPAINAVNLNAIEDSLTKLMNELNYSNSFNLYHILRYATGKNIKIIDECDDSSTWTVHFSVDYYDEYDTIVLGKSGLKGEEPDNIGSDLRISKTLDSTFSCLVSNDGTAITTSNYIYLVIYVSDSTKFTTLKIRLGDDASNYYYNDYTGFSTGWNFIGIAMSAFSTNNSPSGWDAIDYIACYATTTSSASGEYVILNKMFVGRIGGSVTGVNPFVFNNGSGTYNQEPYVKTYKPTFVGLDKRINKTGLQLLEDNLSLWANDTLEDVNSFSIKVECYSKYDGFGCAFQWYVNSSNYLVISVESSSLKIYENASGGGVSAVVTSALDESIEAFDRMELFIEKTSNNILYCSLQVDGQTAVYADYAVTISSTLGGAIGITSYAANQFYMITDMLLGNNTALAMPFMSNNHLLIMKFENEDLLSSTLTQNDDELKLKLPGNCTFEIELVMLVNSASATPDIDVRWLLSNNSTYSTQRIITGLDSGTSDVDSSNVIATDCAFLTLKTYGLEGDATKPTRIVEKATIHTGVDGEIIQIQWCQNVSNATAITVEKGSYIKATKI